MNDYGPNITRLIFIFIARAAVPAGGGLADVVEFFKNPERRKQILAKAEEDAMEAIRIIKTAPDNPYGDDDEKIAQELLNKIKEREKERRERE